MAASFLPVAIIAVVWLGDLAASVTAIVAQPVAVAEMNGSFPYGKSVSMESEKEEQPTANELVRNAESSPAPSRIREAVQHSRSDHA